MFVTAPFRLVKGENAWDEFRSSIRPLQEAAIAAAADIWPGFSFGGIRPGNKEFGITSIRPRDIYGGGTATWVKTYGSAGSWANIFSYNVPEDEIHAFAGVLITDPSLIFAQMRWEVEDRKFPALDIEEARAFPGGFGILFKSDQNEDFIVREEQRVLFRGFQERATRNMTQRVIPLGFQLYKNKDLHITERESGN